MTTSRIRARRLAAAAVGSSLLFLSFSATTAHAIDNKGVVKVQQPGAATVTPDNNPTIKGCSVQVELRGFGGIAEGGEDVTIHFAHQGGEWNGNTADFSPTTGIRVTENKSGTDLNATQTYVIKPVQGVTKQSLKVTAKSAGQDLNSKVFTITDCEQADDTVTDPEPTLNPVVDPSVAPSTDPSGDPSTEPSVQPSADPSADPSTQPSSDPSTEPSGDPSTEPSVQPTADPSADPSGEATTDPSDDATTPEHPEKVNSGGEADASGLIFLGVAGAGLLAAAGYGMNRARRKA